jgi:single-strand DNA-binding protein
VDWQRLYLDPSNIIRVSGNRKGVIRMVNKVVLIGNLTADPDVRASQTGTYVAHLRIATNVYIGKADDGTRKEATDFHSVVFFGKQAEFIGTHFKKGRQVYILGRLHSSSWDDPATGAKRYKTEVIGDEFGMLGQKAPEAAAAA